VLLKPRRASGTTDGDQYDFAIDDAEKCCHVLRGIILRRSDSISLAAFAEPTDMPTEQIIENRGASECPNA